MTKMVDTFWSKNEIDLSLSPPCLSADRDGKRGLITQVGDVDFSPDSHRDRNDKGEAFDMIEPIIAFKCNHKLFLVTSTSGLVRRGGRGLFTQVGEGDSSPRFLSGNQGQNYGASC